MGKLVILTLVGIGAAVVAVTVAAVKIAHLISEAIGGAMDAW